MLTHHNCGISSLGKIIATKEQFRCHIVIMTKKDNAIVERFDLCCEASQMYAILRSRYKRWKWGFIEFANDKQKDFLT